MNIFNFYPDYPYNLVWDSARFIHVIRWDLSIGKEKVRLCLGEVGISSRLTKNKEKNNKFKTEM